MKRFIVEQSDTEFYISHSGLALIGLCLNRYSTLSKTVDTTIPLRHGIAHSDLIKSYLGQLCLGKSDFEAVESVREDRYFKEALAIRQVPSSARLRQRLDADANALGQGEGLNLCQRGAELAFLMLDIRGGKMS